MGTSRKQIATRWDVNYGKRNGYFSSSTNKCVTKREINSIEFLEVRDRYSSENATMSLGGDLNNGYLYAISGSHEIKQTCNSSWNRVNNGSFILSPSISLYLNDTKTIDIEYNVDSNLKIDDADDLEASALCICRKSNLTPNDHCQWITRFSVCAVEHSTRISNSYTRMNTDSISGNVLAIITDGNGSIVGTPHLLDVSTSYITGSFDFIAPTSGNVNLMLLPINIKCKASSLLDVTGNRYRYIGLEFKIENNNTLTKWESIYDSDTKCVQYEDIHAKSNRSFTFYYGIYNNKSSNAKLDTVAVYISDTNTISSGTWTKIGSVDPGTVKSTKTGSFTCTIPANVDLSKPWYLKVACGTTTYNQSWYYAWGNSSSITSSSISWTGVGSRKSYEIGTISLNSSGASVLNNSSYSGGYYGRTASVAALFKIQ